MDYDRDDRFAYEIEWLKDGRTLDSSYIANEFDISKSQARDDLHRLWEEVPLERETGENGKHEYFLPGGGEYLEKTEYEFDDMANWLQGEVEGVHEALNNIEMDGDGPVHILALSELGMGTKFMSSEAWDGLAHELEEYDFEGEMVGVVNGGLLPRVDKRSYKTARQYQRALGEHPDKEPNPTAERLSDKAGLEEMLGESLPEDDAEREEYLDTLLDGLEDIDIEANKQKITNLKEASEVAEDHITRLYDAVGEDFPLHVHMGEQDEQNIEELEDLKIQELTDDQKERLETLDEKIEVRNNALAQLNDELDEIEGNYEDVRADIQAQLDRRADPDDLDLSEYDDIKSDTYEEVIDHQEEIVKDLREIEHNRNAMLVEQAFGEYANVFNRTFLQSDEAELMRALASAEYQEYIKQVGNVESIAEESELMTIEVGGYEVDVAHNMNIASDEPLISGYAKDKEIYEHRGDGDADLLLTGHHGPIKAQPMVEGRGENANGRTWLAALSTFMDGSLIEEYGEDEGANLIKDVKRKSKGLFDSTVPIITLDEVEGEDGKLRRTIRIDGWDGEYLKELGEQLNGEGEPGVDYTEEGDWHHFVARGDDQIGSPHDMAYLHEPTVEESIRDDMANIRAFIDQSDGDTTLIEVGDAFQGDDIYPGQGTEVTTYRGDDRLELKTAVLNAFEDTDVSFDADSEFRQYLQENDIGDETLAALDYAMDRNTDQSAVLGLDNQGELVDEWLVSRYEELLEGDLDDMIVVDGNHYNSNHEGLNESKRIAQMFADDGDVTTAAGNSDGDITAYYGDLQVRAKHRPNGRGRETVDKLLNQALEDDTDVFVAGHLHVPSFGKQEDAKVMMPGSSQATNDFVKGFTDAPAEKGAVYLSVPENDDIGKFSFEHTAILGKRDL